MGKSESAKAFLGIKILLSDLILQINENNIELIKEMLEIGFISDENDIYNDAYSDIIYSINIPKYYLDFKNFLEQEFKNKGTYYSNKIEFDLTSGCLFEKELLLPIKKILETERYGYERIGKNGNNCPIDFDLSLDLEKYKEIEKYTIVFILEQYSG